MRSRRVWLFALIIVLLAWGLTDVRKRARVNPANPAAHRSDVTVFTAAGKAFFDPPSDPYTVTNPRGWHYLYPPIFAIAIAPLSTLPESEQGFVFYLFSLFLLYGCVVETWTLIKLGLYVRPDSADDSSTTATPHRLLWLAAAAILFPMLNTLQRGQVALFALYPLLLGVRLLLSSRTMKGPIAGGALLALPIAIKLTPALPVAFVGWVLWVRAWQVRKEPQLRKHFGNALGVSGGVALGLILWLLVVPGVILGWETNLGHMATWVDRVVSNPSVGRDNDFFSASVRNQSFKNASRLIIGNVHDTQGVEDVAQYPGIRSRAELNASLPDPSIDRILLAVRIGIILLLLIGGIRLARSNSGLALPAALGLGAIGSLVFSPLSWGHHYAIAWPAFVFVPLLLWRSGDTRRAQLLSVSSVVLVVGHYLFVRQLGAIGFLGMGTALWLVVAIGFLPDAADSPAS